ncbi:MAG: tRNA 2-thiocytidine biosynthesis TtcA family protein [Desulfobulbaceae bacterium]|nr:tRNA 2-thiocytidine biosynthesis TtcA family protein [Desulfobulbaceae bacterium]
MNRRVGRAMHTYSMLADGDRVLVAVSGGEDSLVLAWLLDFWRRKAPIDYEIAALHIDMEPDGVQPGEPAGKVRQQLEPLGICLDIIPAAWQPPAVSAGAEKSTRDVCYNCSSSRRKQLFDFARQENCNKVAFGHHQDDIIETFFINLCYGGNISTMVPRQDIFEGRLSLIRPLAFLDKQEISMISRKLGFEPVRSSCPLAEKTGRMDIRSLLAELYTIIPGAKPRIFAALANVREEYLLQRPGTVRSGEGRRNADRQ